MQTLLTTESVTLDMQAIGGPAIKGIGGAEVSPMTSTEGRIASHPRAGVLWCSVNQTRARRRTAR